MKKCIICSKELDDKEEKFCYSCIGFFKGKYKKDYYKKLKRFERILKSRSIKFNGRYKNE